MSVVDYVGIVGDDNLPLELFLGFWEDAEDLSTLSATQISSDPELAAGIWEGQNKKIKAESAYCDQLQAEFDKKFKRLNPILDKLKDIFQEVVGELLGTLVQDAVTLNFGPVAGWWAAIATEVGFEWGTNALINLLTRGNELLEGIKEENDNILEIEPSRENYDYREKILARHREDIRIVLDQIRSAEKSLEIQNQLEMKALLERLTDLALRDDTIEIGNTRLHSKGRVLNYG